MVGKERRSKDELLTSSKHFCMLPWVHVHMWPDSKVFPCCIYDSFYPVATYENSLKEVWNAPVMKQLRRDMMADLPSQNCSRCYDLEKSGIHSLRKTSLESFGKFFDAVDETEDDGHLDKVQMRYLDIRFSNMCNFKCRTCGPDLSSAWVDDHEALYGELPWKVLRVGAHLWDELKPLLSQVESAYFAGGEPVVCDELYQILDHWVDIGHYDVSLGYTTNFSILRYRGKNILDYWKKFPDTRISASIDDSGPRAEYLRKGTVWANIENNRRMMLKECPNIYFEITPTIGIYNVWHFPEFHKDWIEKGLLELNHIRLNILTKPDNLSIAILPPDTRKELIDVWQKALHDLIALAKQKETGYENVQEGYQAVINMLTQSEEPGDLASFWEYSSDLDRVREENIFDVFPEFKKLAPKAIEPSRG